MILKIPVNFAMDRKHKLGFPWKENVHKLSDKFFQGYTVKNSGSGIEIFAWSKKYIDQEPPYLMRQICELQWEEIKTKNSGATYHF